MKRLTIVAAALAPLPAFAASDPRVLVQLMTGVVLLFAVVLGLYFLLRLGFQAYETLFNKDNLQRNDYKPVTLVKFIAGLSIIATAFLQPISIMNMFNDVTGVGTVCMVMTPSGLENNMVDISEMLGDGCLSSFKSDLGTYVDTEGFNDEQLKLYIGLVQLVSFIFFIAGGVYLMRHIIGERNVKVTAFQAVVIMFVASAFISFNGIIHYVEDIRAEEVDGVST